jgi:DNA topoisomerase-1
MLATLELNTLGPLESQAQGKKNVTQAIKDVAKQLGNRPATCRKYYVHPAIIDAYLDGSLFPIMEQASTQKSAASSELHPEEQAVLKLLEQHLIKKQLTEV